jgi:hypothetical protein
MVVVIKIACAEPEMMYRGKALQLKSALDARERLATCCGGLALGIPG